MKRIFYELILKRTSTFCLAIVCSSMFFERVYDHAWEYVFERWNDGRLWMHVKHKYEGGPDEVINVESTVKKSLKPLAKNEKPGTPRNMKNPPTTSDSE